MISLLNTLGGAQIAQIAELITITLADGTVLNYCTGEEDITISGTTYLAALALPILKGISWKLGVEVDTAKLELWAATSSSGEVGVADYFLEDSSGGIWGVGITTGGLITTTLLAGTPNTLYLNDSLGNTWQVRISTGGILSTTSVAIGDNPQSIVLIDSLGITWEVSITTGGLLQTMQAANATTETILASVLQGLFDNAEVLIQRTFTTQWGSYTNGAIILFAGFISDIPLCDQAHAEFDVKSRKELLNIPLPYLTYQPGCRWPLYGAGCGLSASAFAVSGLL